MKLVYESIALLGATVHDVDQFQQSLNFCLYLWLFLTKLVLSELLFKEQTRNLF